MNDIVEELHEDIVVLSLAGSRHQRRVLFVNSYGGGEVWSKIKGGRLPPHHLWGCLELVRMGYQVGLAEPLSHFTRGRRSIPHDLRLFRAASSWLRKGDILYSGHTLLYWLPLLKRLHGLSCHIVSLTYAREDLDFATAHSGIIALTPAAADQARRLAPAVKSAHLGWGVDLSFFPHLPYNPDWFLSCGRTHRDHPTLRAAAEDVRRPIRLISPTVSTDSPWPQNVSITTGGKTDDSVSYHDLLFDYYAGCAGSLVILKPDAAEMTAVGFTNLLEAMAMGRPVIVTRTGALAGEIDVEEAGCGLHVPAADAKSLARAISRLASNPQEAEAMGRRGRSLCERHYNIQRYANDLHSFFESLG